MFGLDYVKLIAIGVVSLVLFLSGWFVNGWRWNHKYEALVTAYKEEAIKAEREARAKEVALQSSIDDEREAKDEKIKAISADLAVALKRLRERTSRSSDSKGSCNCKGADGSKLFREDAEFLTRESARADRAVIELNSCYSSYDAVRQTINQK